jgi:hypothetical protein
VPLGREAPARLTARNWPTAKGFSAKPNGQGPSVQNPGLVTNIGF